MKSMHKLSLIAVLVTLAACSSTNVDLNSQIEMPARFEQTAQATGTAEIAQWWRNWNDPQLTVLIEQGLQQNLDVAMARSRLAEAQANAAYTDADLGPSVSASGSASGSRARVDNPLTGGSSTSSGSYQYAAVTASWELDFFGKKRSDRDAAEAQALSAQDQVYAAQMLVASQIAESYFNIAALQQRQAVLQQYADVLGKLKTYVQGRFNAGQANANDVLQTESRLSSIQANLATFDSQIDSNRRAIAILTGKPTQGFRLSPAVKNPLINLPAAPAGVLPGEVLARRPDLHSYRNQVQAAAAKLASAKADLYPRFDIQFMGGTGRIDVNSDISELKGWAGLVSGGISLPIFTNGRIQANIDVADARLKTALLQYDKALIQALADVDNSYQAQFALNRQIRLLQTAAAQTQKSAANAEKLFQYGEKTLDNTLSERINALNAQEQLIQARLTHAKNLVSLYKALGGGWVK
ncbi:efflux transporter outer membrane subunit [Basfia succiniciproducens]|uniref:efflux transporter outer membrane subunit n=1 Tax=Basfia succiniciproducens TaxID=653940 RepID=UPI0008BE5732|nr:efflux transporter outer membrane subunit [Basfia succiniciproducens]SEQ33005.1 efflux transporter, outer membrane factor (OMF) lipoprotein, NodT family [Basfia succiniciproducens]